MLIGLVLVLNVGDVSAANSTSTTKVSKVTFTTSQISAASSSVKSYVEKNNKLPTTVTVNKRKVSTPQYLQLAVDSVALSQKSNAKITLKNVKKPTSPTQSLKSSELSKKEYLSLAKTISKQIKTTGTAPKYVKTSKGNMRYETIVYTYAKILNFKKANNRLPNFVSVEPWSTSKPVTSEGSPASFAKILKTAAKFGYSGAASDATGLERIGAGDCWAMSDYLHKKFKKAGIKSRIVQYPTSYVSNHRSVQYYKGGNWVDVPYRSYGINMMFNNTSGSKYGRVIAS